jgi:hypothetical protein
MVLASIFMCSEAHLFNDLITGSEDYYGIDVHKHWRNVRQALLGN